MPVTVAEDAYHRQVFVMFEGQELRVDSIGQQWQIDSEVWEDKPVNRIYYRVTLEDAQSLEIFKNMNHGGWYATSLRW